MDPYVLDIPYLLRWLLVHLLILPFRPKKSAEAYQKIWNKNSDHTLANESPLVENTRRFTEGLKQIIGSDGLFFAMRYGRPSIESVLQEIESQKFDHLHLVPLYPHYAMSSTMTAVEETKRILRNLKSKIQLQVIRPFYAMPEFIDPLARSIEERLDSRTSENFLLFSYHGLPERHITKLDSTGNHCLKKTNCCAEDHNSVSCYRHQIIATTSEVAQKLNLKPNQFGFSFQSRLGRAKWLFPNSIDKVIQLAKSGVKHLTVVCPAFVADNLETLEEVNIRLRQTFLDHGGKSFTYIPCLNSDPAWIQSFSELLKKHLHETA